MSEQQAVERVKEPNTIASLVADCRELGIESGETLLVHSSLSALGWTCGGPQAVVDALRKSVGEAGTLLTPDSTPTRLAGRTRPFPKNGSKRSAKRDHHFVPRLRRPEGWVRFRSVFEAIPTWSGVAIRRFRLRRGGAKPNESLRTTGSITDSERDRRSREPTNGMGRSSCSGFPMTETRRYIWPSTERTSPYRRRRALRRCFGTTSASRSSTRIPKRVRKISPLSVRISSEKSG